MYKKEFLEQMKSFPLAKQQQFFADYNYAYNKYVNSIKTGNEKKNREEDNAIIKKFANVLSNYFVLDKTWKSINPWTRMDVFMELKEEFETVKKEA